MTTAIGSIRYATTRNANTVSAWRLTNAQARAAAPGREREGVAATVLIR